MKRQRLVFGVGLLGLVAIATQPAWAETTFNLTTSDKKFLAQENITPGAIKVIAVKVNSTDTGIEIVLETETGTTLSPKTRTQGNNLIADIPNAVLALPQNDKFQLNNPIAGITRISVTQITPTNIRVSVTGETSTPTATIVPSKTGLILGVTSATEEELEIVVTGQEEQGSRYRVPEASAATRTETPIRDIPQSIQVVPRQVIEDQGITTEITDAARNVSGVNIRSGFGGILDDYNIRGFDNFTKLRNGFISEFSQVAPNNIERVEVLKGPASVLYGQFEPGGVINYVTKQPLDSPYYSAAFTAGSYSFYQPSFDISGPLTEDTSLRYRLTASYQNSDSFVDFVDQEIIQVAPTLSYRIGENTNLIPLLLYKGREKN